MGSFDVEMVGEQQVKDTFNNMASGAGESANDALVETAEEIKSDLEDSSPVDSGEYRDSWYIFEVAEDEVWILNEADHAKYVMLPNSKMVGSSKADLPAQGVLHNAKGVAKSNQKLLINNFADELKNFIDSFKK